MKILNCILAGIAMLMFTQTALAGDPEKAACTDAMQLVMDAYNREFNNAETYAVTMTTLTYEDNMAGEPVVTKIWRKGDLFYMENDYMTMYKDNETATIALMESHAIFVKPAEAAVVPSSGSANDPVAQIELLLTMASDVTCEPGSVDIAFSQEKFVELRGLTKVSIAFDSKTGALQKTTYEYRTPDGGSIRQVTTYSGYTTKTAGRGFTGSALSQVVDGTQLKQQYQGFTITDMRN